MKKIIFLFILFSCSKPLNFYDNEKISLSKDTIQFIQPDEFKNIKDKTLNILEILDIALIKNPSTKESYFKAKNSFSTYEKSLSAYYPTIDIDASYTKQKYSSLLTKLLHYVTIGALNPEMSLTYDIYDFGQRKNFSETNKQIFLSTKLLYNREIQNVIKLVVNDYHDFQYQKQILLSIKDNLTDAESTLDASLQKFQNGISSTEDVIQAKTKFLQTKINLIEQETNLENTFYNLATDMGLPANIKFETAETPNEIFNEENIQNLDALIQEAQINRPDFLASQVDVKANQANLNYAKSQSMPILSTSFDIGKNYYDTGVTEDCHYTALIKLNFPLFHGFFYKNLEKEALSQLQKSKQVLKQKELSVIKDVSSSHITLKNAIEKIKYSNDYLSASQESFVIALKNYKLGITDILDVLSAQASLADAREKNAKSKRDLYVGFINLAYSTGNINFNKEIQGE